MGERSSRRIERLCERDVAFHVIAVNTVPDHVTIARFRKAYRDELEGLFGKVLKLCAEAGLVKVGVVALDGTKIEANVSLLESSERGLHNRLQERDHLFDPPGRSRRMPTFTP